MTTERPILFSAPMVRSLLAGTKTQTRRPLRDGTWWTPQHGVIRMASAGLALTGFAKVPCPYGKPGDRLWVRESHMDLGACFLYRADHGAETERALVAPGQRWRPSIHMPRAASRVLLEVTEVRVEPLQAISRGDAMAEGCPFANMAAGPDPRDWYRDLWNEINGPGSWYANPWVWAVSFKRVEAAHG